jgi:hypothetical protein
MCTPVPQLLFDLTSPASTQFCNFFFDVHVNLDKLCNNTCKAAGFLKPISLKGRDSENVEIEKTHDCYVMRMQTLNNFVPLIARHEK